MLLECRIRNVSRYKHIIIKKFYQVIFWEANSSKIVIYTGIVAGFNLEEFDKDKPCGTYSGLAVRVHFQMPSYQKQIIINDVTSEFVSHAEIFPLKAVWGYDTRLLLAPKDINDWLIRSKEIMPCLYDPLVSDSGTLITRALEIRDPDKTSWKMTSLAIPVDLQRDENGNYKGYLIRTDRRLPCCVDIINWSRTDIEYKGTGHRFVDNGRLEYSFRDCGEAENTFSCPDFRVYFVPPLNYEVASSLFAKALCSSDPQNKMTIEDRNAVQKMVIDESKYFSVWIHEHIITSRNVYRVTKPLDVDRNDKGFSLSVSIDNSKARKLGELMIGLIVSIIIGYGMDSSRIKQHTSSFPISPDTDYFIMSLLFAIDVMLSRVLGIFSSTSVSRIDKYIVAASIVTPLLWAFILHLNVDTLPIQFLGMRMSNVMAVTNYLVLILQVLSSILMIARTRSRMILKMFIIDVFSR